MINPNDSAHVRSLNPTDTALSSSDVRPVSPAQDAVSDEEAAEWAALADAVTEGSWTASGRTVLGDGYGAEYVSIPDTPADAAFIASAWAAVPRLLADRERLTAENARMRQVAELRVGTWRDTAARLEGERDRARGTAATLEAENARLTEALYLTRITLEATFRVLHEASGLPDDIDDPDCRDEMVLALRPRAEKAEAENARLREGIEALMRDVGKAQPAHVTPGIVAVRLKALLADTDSAKDEGGEG